MFKVHLKKVLNQYGYTLYDLSDAILDFEGVSESTVYRFGRGGQNLTLKKLELILKAVRSLTGQPISLSDLISDEEEVTPSGSEGVSTPSEALMLLAPHESEYGIDAVWELVAQRAEQRVSTRRGRWWVAASALAILGLILLGSANWKFPPGLPATNPIDRLEAITLSAAATSSHTGAKPAVHMELKALNPEGHAVGRPVCKIYGTPANTKPRVTHCPNGEYKEQLFDEGWFQVGERTIVIGSSGECSVYNWSWLNSWFARKSC